VQWVCFGGEGMIAENVRDERVNSNPKHTMIFWKKLLGVKDSQKAEIHNTASLGDLEKVTTLLECNPEHIQLRPPRSSAKINIPSSTSLLANRRGWRGRLRSRLARAAKAFRDDAAPPDLEARNLNARLLDATAANLIAVHEKVRQIHQGQIPLPEVVELFVTNYCGFACPHCRCAKHHGGQTEFMSLSTLTGLLTELASRNVKTLELSGGGEPLDHPKIDEILHRLVAGGFRVGLITSGYRFTAQPALMDPFMLCGDWIRFSLDGISDSVYRTVHGRDDLSYQALREVMATMAKRVRAQGGLEQRPKIGAKLLVQQPNQHQVLEAVEEAQRLGLHYLQFKWLEGHPRSVPVQERPAILDALRRRVAEMPAASVAVDVLPGYGGAPVHERCLMSVLHPLIDWDGTIYLCAFFHHRKIDHSIGNITRQAFFDCWGSPIHREQLQKVNPQQCVPNCPLLRYNPVIQFILREDFRFPYI